MENEHITRAEVNRLEDTIRVLREENKRHRSVLEWYADPEKYHLLFNRKFAKKMSEADIDQGERARKALENA